MVTRCSRGLPKKGTPASMKRQGSTLTIPPGARAGRGNSVFYKPSKKGGAPPVKATPDPGLAEGEGGDVCSKIRRQRGYAEDYDLLISTGRCVGVDKKQGIRAAG